MFAALVLCLAVAVQADQLLERPNHYADIVGSLEEQHGPLHTWNASTVHLLLRQASFSDAAADALLSNGVDGYMLSELHVDTFREALGPIAAKKLELLLRDVRAHTGAPGLMSFSEYRARHGDLVTLGLPFLIASPRLGLAAMALDMPDLEQRMAEERGARDVRPTSGVVDRLFGGVYNALSWLLLPELRVWAIVRVFRDTDPIFVTCLGLLMASNVLTVAAAVVYWLNLGLCCRRSEKSESPLAIVRGIAATAAAIVDIVPAVFLLLLAAHSGAWAVSALVLRPLHAIMPAAASEAAFALALACSSLPLNFALLRYGIPALYWLVQWTLAMALVLLFKLIGCSRSSGSPKWKRAD